jgi:hypothetical protein
MVQLPLTVEHPNFPRWCGLKIIDCMCRPCPAHDGFCRMCPKIPLGVTPLPAPSSAMPPTSRRADPEPPPVAVEAANFYRLSEQLRPIGSPELLPQSPEPHTLTHPSLQNMWFTG